MIRRPARTETQRRCGPALVIAAIQSLKEARLALKAAGALHAAEKVRRALTSAEGALRHADGLKYRPR